MNIVYRDFSEAEIDKLLAQSQTDLGTKYWSVQTPYAARQIVAMGTAASPECMSGANQRVREEFIAKATARLKTLKAEEQLLWKPLADLGLDEKLFIRLLKHFMDGSSQHYVEWARLRGRFDARIESFLVEYRSAGNS
jgi:hypothetical protein